MNRIPLAILFCASIASSVPADKTKCPPPPDAWQPVEQELRLGDSAFELSLTPAAGDPTRGRPLDRLELRVDLVVRRHDPITGNVRATSQPTGITGRYKWSADDGSSAGGLLEERVSALGSSLGFTTSVPLPVPIGSYRVTVELDRARGASDCPGFPLTLRYVLGENELIRLEPVHAAGPTQRAPEGNTRVNLLGQIDIRDFEASSDVWGYSNGATHLAILGSVTGTLFIDVTDPFNPTQAGFIPGPSSSWRDMKTYLNYAYIVTEGGGSGRGLQIVDLADPFNPTLVNTYAVNANTSHNIWIDTDRGHAWLVGTGSGAHVLDLSDPENPVEIGSFSDRYVHDVFVRDGLAYFSEINSGLHEIVDAQDPSNLQILSTWGTPFHLTHNSWPNQDHTLLVTTDEATGGHAVAYDITNKAGPPVMVGEFDPDPGAIVHNVLFDDVDGERVAISHYGLGFQYIDLQRPSVPVLLGSYDTYPAGESGYNGAWGVYPFDPRGYFYVSDIQTGLYVLEYAPTGGAFTGKVVNEQGQGISGAQVQILASGVAYATDADGEFGVYGDAGQMLLRVKAPGYQTKLVDAGALVLGGSLDVVTDLVPLPTTTVTGVARRASDMTPLAQVQVTVLNTPLFADTDASGAFTLVDVPVGQRVLAADAVGFSGVDATLMLAPGQPAQVDFVLQNATFGDDLDVDTGWTRGIDTVTGGWWVRVDPYATGNGLIQPEDDHTPDPGVMAFITGQGLPGVSPEFGDVDGGTTEMLSPIIDLSGAANPSFQYYRWFSAQAASLDGGSYRVEISDDGGTTWTTVELLTEDANSWTLAAVPVASYVGLTEQFQARFSCEAIPSLSNSRILECGFDDVSIVEECRSRLAAGVADADRDGKLDLCDLCPLDPEDDVDEDGLCADVDNAPFLANVDQTDGDGDGIGDPADNCAGVVNVGQRDLDLDGLGDACDADIDGDGIDDVSDLDRDNDGVDDVSDSCVEVPDAAQLDRDGDGDGDACDSDDGVVHGLRLKGNAIRWQREDAAGAYNVYRGDVGPAILLGFATCRANGIVGELYVDNDLPQQGDGYIYLVAPVFSGVEGAKGFASDGAPRQLGESCP